MDIQQTDQFVEAAYLAHLGALQRRLTVTTRDPSVAEDLAQEAFLRMVTEVRAGRIPDEPGAWLQRVGHNLAMSRGRHLSVVARRESELARPDEPKSPERQVVDAEDGRQLHRALETLNATDRQALVLAAHGVRGPEIARSIGRTEGATRTLICRARSKLRVSMIAAGAV